MIFAGAGILVIAGVAVIAVAIVVFVALPRAIVALADFVNGRKR